MDVPNFLSELLGPDETSAETTSEEQKDTSAQASRKARKPRGQAKTVPEDLGTADNIDVNQSAPDEPALLNNAAVWSFREMYPEGMLGDEATAQIRAAKAKLNPVAMAFKRHTASTVRSEDAMRRALAKSYTLAESLRDQPQVINALLERRRIKSTKPVRENLFLAVLKVVNPETAPDTLTRWAGALAFAAASSCPPDSVPQFLRTTGIRKAADRWTELRRAIKSGQKGRPASKPTPLDELRKKSLGLSLADELPVPDEVAGAFLLVAERTNERVVVHGATDDPGLVNKVVRKILRTQSEVASPGKTAESRPS